MFLLKSLYAQSAYNHEPMWIEEYWWTIVLAVIAVAAVVFAVLYFRNRSEKMVDVTVYANDEGKTLSVKKGSPYNPPMPKKEGYTFKGWYLDSACTVPWLSTYKVKKTMCLYADWQKD